MIERRDVKDWESKLAEGTEREEPPLVRDDPYGLIIVDDVTGPPPTREVRGQRLAWYEKMLKERREASDGDR